MFFHGCLDNEFPSKKMTHYFSIEMEKNMFLSEFLQAMFMSPKII